jgi:hypothetical protein
MFVLNVLITLKWCMAMDSLIASLNVWVDSIAWPLIKLSKVCFYSLIYSKINQKQLKSQQPFFLLKWCRHANNVLTFVSTVTSSTHQPQFALNAQKVVCYKTINVVFQNLYQLYIWKLTQEFWIGVMLQ